MEGMALKFIGAGLMSFGMLGAAIGVGNIFGSLLNAIARTHRLVISCKEWHLLVLVLQKQWDYSHSLSRCY
jgi:F0F1-type ATP synthase membrane subunit c/vacuolar-type H+-ATPase subunit K